MATSDTLSKPTDTLQHSEEKDSLPAIENIAAISQQRTLKNGSFDYTLDTQSKKTSARSNLLCSLKDRGLKGPLKWSRWVSEVNIPDYRTECRQLGAPLLFTYHRSLPTPLCKKEEQGDLTEPNSPMATFSYFLKNDSRRIHQKRRNLSCIPGLEREVSISELHRMITSPTAAEIKRNKYLHDPLQISIQEQEGIKVNNSAFESLPRIKLTLKPAARSISDNTMASYNKPGKLHSYSWENIHSKTFSKRRGMTSYEFSLQAKPSFEIDSLDGPIDEDTKQAENYHNNKTYQAAKDGNNGAVNLRTLKRQSRTEITRDWVYKSPLGPEKADDADNFHYGISKKKAERKVRFGGGEWIYKDRSYAFD